MWNYFYKTKVILNTNYITNYDIINNESKIEYVHRTKLAEQYKRDPNIRQEASKKANYKCFLTKIT